jgi:hypothetical protein
MYVIEATGQTEKSYFKAIEIATELNSNVIEESHPKNTMSAML